MPVGLSGADGEFDYYVLSREDEGSIVKRQPEVLYRDAFNGIALAVPSSSARR
jgi:hypothetical protein